MKELKILIDSLEELRKIIESGECSREVIERIDRLEKIIMQYCELNNVIDIELIYKHKKNLIHKCATEAEKTYCRLLAVANCFGEWEDYYVDMYKEDEKVKKLYREHLMIWSGEIEEE